MAKVIDGSKAAAERPLERVPPSQAPSTAATFSTPELTAAAPCAVDEHADGSIDAHIYIPPEIAKRLKTRAHTQDLAGYLWENVFRRSLEAHVY